MALVFASAVRLPVVVRIPAGPLGSLKCDPPKGNGRRPKKNLDHRYHLPRLLLIGFSKFQTFPTLIISDTHTHTHPTVTSSLRVSVGGWFVPEFVCSLICLGSPVSCCSKKMLTKLGNNSAARQHHLASSRNASATEFPRHRTTRMNAGNIHQSVATPRYSATPWYVNSITQCIDTISKPWRRKKAFNTSPFHIFPEADSYSIPF